MIHKLVYILIFSSFTLQCVAKLGGNFSEKPEAWKTKLSPGAKALLLASFKGLENKTIFDYHTHIVGLGNSCKKCYVNPKMRSFWHLPSYTKFKIYLSALGVTDIHNSDTQAIERLQKLVVHSPFPSKHYLLAFDKYYTEDGKVDPDKTEFYTPNSYAYSLAEKNPQIFIQAISIHPYRKDALERLEYWAQKGSKLIKWLPNAQGIDPANPKLVPFYKKVKQLGMAILTHSGDEKAVESEDDQKLGNPLLLRLPLNLGVKIIVAHCASLGKNIDLEDPNKAEKANYQLFLRLLNDPKYNDNLYGELSAITLVTRIPEPLHTVLKSSNLHSRLVNGSDYPIPAINALIHTGEFVEMGMLSEREQKYINEIYQFNPILFDFVLKRTLKDPTSKQKFADEIFTKDIFASHKVKK